MHPALAAPCLYRAIPESSARQAPGATLQPSSWWPWLYVRQRSVSCGDLSLRSSKLPLA